MGKDGRLVVARGAGENTLFAVDTFDLRLEGRDSPFGGRHGLAIIVRVEDKGVLSAGSHDLAEDYRWRSGECKQPRIDSTVVEGFKKEVCITLKARGIRSDIGDGEKIAELANQFGPMSRCILLRGLKGCRLCRQSNAETNRRSSRRVKRLFSMGPIYTAVSGCGYRVRQKKYAAMPSPMNTTVPRKTGCGIFRARLADV